MIASSLALLAMGLQTGRIDPSAEGVYLHFRPEEFRYEHHYEFKNLEKEATAVYFLLPLDYQEQTIRSAKYYVGETELKYKVIVDTIGWKVARAEVSPSKNVTVRMVVNGIFWNGKLGTQPYKGPKPPAMSEEMLQYFALPSPFLNRVQEPLDKFLKSSGLNSLPAHFPDALVKVHQTMAKNFRYDAQYANIEDILSTKGGNCNATNRFLSSVFDLSPNYAAAELNGIIVDGDKGGWIHAMSLAGKRNWNILVPTDGVKFDNGTLDSVSLSGHSMGPMLICQLGFGDPAKDSKGGVVYQVLESKRNTRAPNPGGLIHLYDKDGKFINKSGGVKKSYGSKVVSDFEALQRELKAREGSR